MSDEMPILRPAAQALAEVEERLAADRREAAQVFMALMEEAIARYQQGRPMRLEVKQAHVSVAVEMLAKAGYRYKLLASHPADGGRVVVIEVSFAEHHTVDDADKDEVSLSDGREPWRTR